MLRESHRPGIEPETCKSQVQRHTAEPPRNTQIVHSYGFVNHFYAMRPYNDKFGKKITQNKGHFAAQGHSKSPILVPIESSYTTSY